MTFLLIIAVIWRKHTGEKPFKCKTCEFECTQEINLIQHMRIHTGEKPFKCNQCDYSSTQSGDLNKHIKRKHSVEKPFQCDKTLCKYKCSCRNNRMRHMNRKHIDKYTKPSLFSFQWLYNRLVFKWIIKTDLERYKIEDLMKRF